MRRTLTATMPDGTKLTRTTEREYKLVVAFHTAGTEKHPAGWGHMQWSTRHDLAEKCKRQYMRNIGKEWGAWGIFTAIEIFPVDE